MPQDYILQQEDIDALVKQGYNPDELPEVVQRYTDEELAAMRGETKQSPMGTAVRHLASSVVPSLGAGAGMAAASWLLGPGVGVPVTIAAGLVGGMGGGMAAGAAQEALMPEEWKRSLAEGAAENPKSAIAGQLAAMPLGGMSLSPKGAIRAAQAIPEMLAGKLTLEGRQALINSGVGATLGGVQEAAAEKLHGGDLDPSAIAKQALVGGVFTKPSFIGRELFGFHDVPVRDVTDPTKFAANISEGQTVIPPDKAVEKDAAARQAANKQADAERQSVPYEQKVTPELEKFWAEYPEYDPRKNPKAKLDRPTLIEEIQTELKPDEIPIPKKLTELEQKVNDWLVKKGKHTGLDNNPAYVKMLTEEVLRKNGLTVTEDGTIVTPEGKPAAGEIDLATGDIKYNPKSADLTTLPHEGGHAWWVKLLPEEKSTFRQEAEKVKGKKLTDAEVEEFAVQQVGLEFIARQADIAGEGNLGSWWNDLKVNAKRTYKGNLTPAELRRAIVFDLVHGTDKLGIKGGGKVNATRYQTPEEPDKPAFDAEQARKDHEEEMQGLYGKPTEPTPEPVEKGLPFDKARFDKMHEDVDNIRNQPEDESTLPKTEPVINPKTEPAINPKTEPVINPKTGQPYGRTHQWNIKKAAKEGRVIEHGVIGRKEAAKVQEASWDAGKDTMAKILTNWKVNNILAKMGTDWTISKRQKVQDIVNDVIADIRTHGSDVDADLSQTILRRASKYTMRFIRNEMKQPKTVSLDKPMGDSETTFKDILPADESQEINSDELTITPEEETAPVEEITPTVTKEEVYKPTVRELMESLEGSEEADSPKVQEMLDKLDAMPKDKRIDMDEFIKGIREKKYQESGTSTLPKTKGTPDVHEFDKTQQGFIPALEATFDKVRHVSVPLAQAFTNYSKQVREFLGMRNVAIEELQQFSKKEIAKAVDELRTNYRERKSAVPTSPAAKVLTEYFKKTRLKQNEEGLLIDGREATVSESYIPDMLNDRALDIFVNKSQSPEAMKMEEAWIDYVVRTSKGEISREQATKNIGHFINALGGAHNNYLSVEFNALRKAAGYGLPEGLRETDGVRIVEKYGRRYANDMAMYMHLEKPKHIAESLMLYDPNVQNSAPVSGAGGDPRLSRDTTVRDAMKWVTGGFAGTMSRSMPKVNAFVRLVNNSLLGTATGIRDTVSIPLNSIPYINKFSDLGAFYSAFTNLRENSRRALETGARQPSIDRLQFTETLTAPDVFTALTSKVATFMRRVQGREMIENFNRNITFSIGRELAARNIIGAKGGHEQSVKWLKKFSDLVEGDVTKMSGKELQTALDRMAANFTDRNQGTYGGEGLPVGMVESQFAPFWALQKWSLEKSNVIYKDVVNPFLTGENRIPMLTYTLGAFLTGAAIQQLNELMTGKKAQDPTLKEVQAHGGAANYVDELATIMQLGSFAGLLGDAAKFTSDLAITGKTPRNIVSFPTATAGLDLQERTVDMMEAIRNGENSWDVFKQFAMDTMVNNVQMGRMIANRTVNDDKIERSQKFRDLRVYNQLEGKPASNIPTTNRYLGLEAREFKQETDPAKVATMVRGLVSRIMAESGGNPYEVKRKLAGLKANSFNIMPSPNSNRLEFMNYYKYLVQTQGKAAADARLQEYMKQTRFNKLKSSVIP